jgi:membrane protein DedA with SNARE-associated domain
VKNFVWEWRGLVASILGLGLAITIVIIATGSTSHLNSDEGAVLSTTLGALVGALASYLGAKHYSNGNGESNGSASTKHPTDS